jgi:hypothetical protein
MSEEADCDTAGEVWLPLPLQPGVGALLPSTLSHSAPPTNRVMSNRGFVPAHQEESQKNACMGKRGSRFQIDRVWRGKAELPVGRSPCQPPLGPA